MNTEELKIIITAEARSLQTQMEKAKQQFSSFEQNAKRGLNIVETQLLATGVSAGRMAAKSAAMGATTGAALATIGTAATSASNATKKASNTIADSIGEIRSEWEEVPESIYLTEEALEEVLRDTAIFEQQVSEYAKQMKVSFEDAADAIINKQKDVADKIPMAFGDATKKSEKHISDIKKAVQKAQKAVKGVSFKELEEEFKKVGDAGKKVFSTMVKSIAGVGTALIALGASSKEYRTAQAKLIAAFETAGASADVAKQTYNDLYRVLGDDQTAVEAANHLAKLTTNQKELEQWTKIAQGVYATFGDSLPIESLTEAANETARSGELTGALTDALVWAGVSEDDFKAKLLECNTEAEREALIRETLSGLYDEAADKYEDTAASVLEQNEAQLKLKEATAKLGEAIAPVQAALTEFAAIFVEEFAPAIEEFVNEYGEEIKETLAEIATAIGNVLSWLFDNWELVSTIGTIVLAIAAALSVLSTVMGIVNAVMMASPVTWIVLAIVAAVAALTAAIVLCIKYWDEIKHAVQVAIDAIVVAFDAVVNAIKVAWDWLVNLFTSVVSWINTNLIQPIINFFKKLWNDIVNGFHAVIDPWIETIKSAWTVIDKNVIQPIKNGFTSLISWFNTSILKPLGNFFTSMWNGLKSGASSAWQGIKNVFSSVTSWFQNTFSKAWSAVKNVFSTGGKIFSGIKEGIESVFKTVVNGIIGGINKIVAVPFKAINKMLSTLNGIEILGLKPFSWVTTFSIPQIPLLAKGGVIDSATLAVLGEQGKEAVVPLENNTEWIDTIVKKLADKQGGNRPIILKVDKRVLGQVSAEGINDITRQTGSIPLVLA